VELARKGHTVDLSPVLLTGEGEPLPSADKNTAPLRRGIDILVELHASIAFIHFL